MLQTPFYRRKIVWPDKSFYFFTLSTFAHLPYFQSDRQKQLVLNFIKDLQVKHKVGIKAFAILLNHIHLLFYLKQGKAVSLVKGFLQGNITREYNREYELQGKSFWHPTKVLYVKDSKSLFNIIAYIDGNPLKHKAVGTIAELSQYHFSSFRYHIKEFGYEFMEGLVYKFINVKEDSWGQVNFLGRCSK